MQNRTPTTAELFSLLFSSLLPLLLVEQKVSVPMELCLTVKKLGTDRKGEGQEQAGHWQKLAKVVRNAHRPVVFEVDGLIPDTRCSLQRKQ